MAEPAESPSTAASEGERLQKVLARIGLGSRRACENLITARRITVNGEVPVLGRRIDPTVDEVELDGVPLPVLPGLVHYVLNKPAGVVSTAEDTHGRPTVVDLVPDDPRVFPVGRLDMDSEGLLLLTNDGRLTHRLTHPSFGVPKEYLVHVEGEPSASDVRRLREGVDLDDGTHRPRPGGGGGAHPSPHGDPRGPEPTGPPDVRGGRAPGGPAGPDPHRAAHRSDPEPGAWRPLTIDEVRALAAAAIPADGPTGPLSSMPG